MDGDKDHTCNSTQTGENSAEGNSTQMEHSVSSLVFKGPVSEAIQATKMSMKILFVYIGGPGEDSYNLDQSTWQDSEVVKLLSECSIVLYMLQGSAEALHFSAIYPHKTVPAISAVGYNGTRLWHHEGYISAKDLIASIEKARTDLHSQEVSVANMIATAIAASRQEPMSIMPSFNVDTPVLEGITGRVDPSPSLGEIPLNQSASNHTACEPSSGTEETGQTNEQEEMVSASAMRAPVIPSRSSTTISFKCDNMPDSTQSSSSVVEIPGSLSFRNETIADPMHEIVEHEKSSDVSAFNLGNINSQTGDKVDSGHRKENEGGKFESDCNSSGQETRNHMSSDLGRPTTEIVPEVEISNRGSSPVMDDHSAMKLPNRDLSSFHLQIRLLDGSSLQAKFAATDTLRKVKAFVNENRTDGNSAFSLAVPYPRKVFSEEDMEKLLPELNLGTRVAIILVPSATGPSVWHSSSQANSMVASSSPQNSEAGPGFFARILSYINPFSYFAGNSSNQESTSRGSTWQYGPNISLEDAYKDVGQNSMSTSKPNIPGKGQKVGSSSNVEKRGWGSNIHTLKHYEDEPFRDRNAFWNGNSTQFGGDDSKRD